MKTKITSLLLCAITALCLSSCQTTGGLGSYADYIEPAATLATAVALDEARESDRVKTARTANEIADYLVLLTDFNTTGKDISAAVIARTDGSPKWVALGAALGIIYDQNKAKLGASKSSVIINAIASGVKTGTAPYL